MVNEFNGITINGQKVDFSQYKNQADKADYADNKAQNSIFEAFNKVNENGEKDSVLDENEITDFQERLISAAGDDKDLSEDEARSLLDSVGLNDVETSELFEFIKSLSNQITDKVKDSVDSVVEGTQNVVAQTKDETTPIGSFFSKISTSVKAASDAVSDKFKEVSNSIEEFVFNPIEEDEIESEMPEELAELQEPSSNQKFDDGITGAEIGDSVVDDNDVDDVDEPDDDTNSDEVEEEEQEDDIVRVEETFEAKDVQDAEDVDDSVDDSDDDDDDDDRDFIELDEVEDDIVRVEAAIDIQDVQDGEKPE